MGNCEAIKKPPEVRTTQRQPTNPNDITLPIVLKQKQQEVIPISPKKQHSISNREIKVDLDKVKHKDNDKDNGHDKDTDKDKVKYTMSERGIQIEELKSCYSQFKLAASLNKLNIDLLKKLEKQDINIICFVKCFKVETSTQQSEEDLISYFENIKDNLVSGFKNSLKEDKAKILDEHSEYDRYKKNFQNDKVKARNIIEIVSEYKDQMVFQMLNNHTAIFSELARKLEKDKELDFFNDIKNSIVKLHNFYLDIVENTSKKKLQKVYHAYLNEEYNFFCLFHNNQTSVSQVAYTEFKPTELLRPIPGEEGNTPNSGGAWDGPLVNQRAGKKLNVAIQEEDQITETDESKPCDSDPNSSVPDN